MSQLPENPETRTKEETQGVSSSLNIFDLRKLIAFREEGPYVQVLSDIGTARLVLFAFKAGQQLKEHSTSSSILVQVLNGQITFSAANNSIEMQAGMMFQLEANMRHSVDAKTNAVILVIMTPSPSYHSLDREVFQGFTPQERQP